MRLRVETLDKPMGRCWKNIAAAINSMQLQSRERVERAHVDAAVIFPHVNKLVALSCAFTRFAAWCRVRD